MRRARVSFFCFGQVLIFVVSFYFIFGTVSVTVFAFAFSRAEGTGFAGGGMAETSKTGIAFQG